MAAHRVELALVDRVGIGEDFNALAGCGLIERYGIAQSRTTSRGKRVIEALEQHPDVMAEVRSKGDRFERRVLR
jgi:microsomal dipeptidase-like Zn-dependent dipeptidase